MNNMETTLISAFPGTGKSHNYRNQPAPPVFVLDSDSSEFSWIINSDGEKVRNPNFPENYMTHIKENMGTAKIIFISSHKEVRDALVQEGLDFTLIFPERGLKEEYVQRYTERGSPQGFIDLLGREWDNWIDELEGQSFCTHIQLKSNEYISDVI
jgi:hypothetical protein